MLPVDSLFMVISKKWFGSPINEQPAVPCQVLLGLMRSCRARTVTFGTDPVIYNMFSMKMECWRNN